MSTHFYMYMKVHGRDKHLLLYFSEPCLSLYYSAFTSVLPSVLPCRQCTHAPRATHSVMALLSHSFCEKANLTNLDFLLKFDHYITLALH